MVVERAVSSRDSEERMRNLDLASAFDILLDPELGHGPFTSAALNQAGEPFDNSTRSVPYMPMDSEGKARAERGGQTG